VTFEALALGQTTVFVGRNPTITGPDSVTLQGGATEEALVDSVQITVVEPATAVPSVQPILLFTLMPLVAYAIARRLNGSHTPA